ncbi:Phosphate regulon transcriptional regulatory protein PhoB (SphR) [hydrothermal vent metagenome]|uniref:Phosphate regulon transcriptional regulatory protein PhoB (SphR) n=1 Tax=hydrothermal vent metagenome TaxID=652676 RepID=A0A1W1C9H1_9ZZZZ
MKNILIIEDNEMQQQILSIFLKNLSCHCSIASSAEEGESLIQKHTFDLILLDINLPGMSGLYFLKKIRQTYSKSELPVFMISALSQPINLEKAAEEGANLFLKKPIALDVLKDAIEAMDSK